MPKALGPKFDAFGDNKAGSPFALSSVKNAINQNRRCALILDIGKLFIFSIAM